jgi:hypothetical protein
MLQSRTRSVPCAASTTPPSAQTHPGGLGGLVATPISALLPCSSRHTSPNFDLPMCQSPCSSRHTCPYSDLPNDQPPCSLGTHLHTPTSQTISPPALEAHIFVLRPPKLSTPLLFRHTSSYSDLPMCQSPCSSRHTSPYSDLPNYQPPCSSSHTS